MFSKSLPCGFSTITVKFSIVTYDFDIPSSTVTPQYAYTFQLRKLQSLNPFSL